MTMDGWVQEVGRVVADEFSDLSGVTEMTRTMLRLLLAALLGGLLGLERERKGKSAGVRTHMLVALGAALFVLTPEMAGMTSFDLTRVIQGVTAGVGFLGAGTILKGNEEDRVKGLTTAAGIWLTAAIGVAVGVGHQATAVLATLLALFILFIVPAFVQWFQWRRQQPVRPE
jgi:putative Mg2+ transporter-C (MgtC) family protein